MKRERKTVRRGAVGSERAAAGRAQGVEQAAHGAGSHGFVAVEFILAARGEREEGGQEAGGRAGVADM